jgi:hypothetical protein
VTKNQGMRSAVAVTFVLMVGACQPLPMDGTAAIPPTDGTAATAAGAPATATTAEWVFLARNEVIYLRWSAPGGAVAGVIQTARRNAVGTNVSVTSGIVAGAANGPHVVLRTGRQTWSGTVDGDSLVLAVTRPDGSRDELQFARGSVGEFDAAVAELRSASTTTTTTVARSRRTAATTTTVGSASASASTAPPPTGSNSAAVVADLEAATSQLRELRATDAAVSETEGALDAMYTAADAVYSALGRPRCGAARNALGRLDSAATQVEQEVATLEQAATQIEDKRAVVMDAGLRVVALDDPGWNPVIVWTNDELASADTAIAELRRYSGEVRAAVTSTAADAARAVDTQC